MSVSVCVCVCDFAPLFRRHRARAVGFDTVPDDGVPLALSNSVLRVVTLDVDKAEELKAQRLAEQKALLLRQASESLSDLLDNIVAATGGVGLDNPPSGKFAAVHQDLTLVDRCGADSDSDSNSNSNGSPSVPVVDTCVGGVYFVIALDFTCHWFEFVGCSLLLQRSRQSFPAVPAKGEGSGCRS